MVTGHNKTDNIMYIEYESNETIFNRNKYLDKKKTAIVSVDTMNGRNKSDLDVLKLTLKGNNSKTDHMDVIRAGHEAFPLKDKYDEPFLKLLNEYASE